MVWILSLLCEEMIAPVTRVVESTLQLLTGQPHSESSSVEIIEALPLLCSMVVRAMATDSHVVVGGCWLLKLGSFLHHVTIVAAPATVPSTDLDRPEVGTVRISYLFRICTSPFDQTVHRA